MRRAAGVIIAMVLVAGVAIGPGSPAPALGTAWSIQPSASPPGPPNGEFTDVACPSPSTCFAVGSSLVEQWNGTDWSVVDLPGPDAVLNGVACPGPATCIAVGNTTTNGTTTPLTEIWNGTTWAAAASPTQVQRLDTIACTSTTHCFALESYGTDLVEWNGTTWSGVPIAALPEGSALFDVACASSTRCFVVGAAYVSGNSVTAVEQWNGTSWSPMVTPTPTGTSSTLNGVSCATATSCVAVGNSQVLAGGTHTLAEHWNGTSWSVVATPNLTHGESTYLMSVSCSSATDCFAVSDGKLIEHWNGTSWSVVPSPDHAPLVESLRRVACLSPTSCLAVGYAYSTSKFNPKRPPQPTVERWNGTSWTFESIPLPVPSSSTLLAVSCAGPVCFGVGQYLDATATTAPLIERFTPTGWVVVPSPRPPGTDSLLSGVSCPTVTVCFAVGNSFYGKTLVEVWRGNAWTIMKSPNKPNWPSRLTAISCTSPKNCFAVGRYDAALLATLIEHWDGTKWSIVPSPSRRPSPQFSTPGVNDLQGISCASAVSCFAVGGDQGYNSTSSETLVERWNGSKWSIVKSPNSAHDRYNNLSSVSCPSGTSCYAVGVSYTQGGLGPQRTLIEHWNGTAWTRMASPDRAGAKRSVLLGVSCATATSCVAVGNNSDSTGSNNTTLVKVLAGTTWSISASANPVPGDNSSLNGVSCTAAQCEAVGGYEALPAQLTLAELLS